MKDPFQMQAGEHMILRFRKHWFVLLMRLLGVFVLAVFPFLVYAGLLFADAVPPGLRATHFFQFMGTWWLFIIWLSVAGVWTKYYLDMWLVTDRRIVNIEQLGLFDRDVTAWGIERILEVSVHVGNFIETFLDFGTLEIHTAGQDDVHEHVTGVPEPAHVREVIMAETSRVNSLEQANRNQEELLHTISHEVKSYLTRDAASLASIAQGDVADPSEIRTFAQSALGETRKGVSAIMNILEDSDAKKGTLQIAEQKFDLRALIEDIYLAFKPVADRKHIAFTFLSDAGVYEIQGDKIKLRDLVLRNVVDNALRYTSVGSVRISLSKNGNTATCIVSDTGVGISREDMKKLFTPGGAGEHSKDINPDSTGFGLVSAKKIVEAHNGDIGVVSAGENKGATFTITLPLVG